MDQETRKIVFLGASFAGAGAAHYFLKHEFARLPTDSNIKYQVVVVSPSSKLYVRPASPLAAARPDIVSPDSLFEDVESPFKQYGDKAQFIHGKVVTWDEQARKILLETGDGNSQSVEYWALILATGSKTAAPHFALQGGSYEETRAALKDINSHLSHKPRRVVIAGGGATAVETAGEIGHLLNGQAGWFQSRPSDLQSKVTIITSGAKLLPGLRQSIADQAEVYLNKVGVDVKYNAKVVETSALSRGKTMITLHDGDQIEADLYIPAMGVQPLSEYVPQHLKDSKGFVTQNNKTFRVENAGLRVYAIGDVGTSGSNDIPSILFGVPVLATNLRRDIVAAHRDAHARATGNDREFIKSEKEMQIVVIGRSKGVGAIMGWRVPSWFVWMIKGRTYMMTKPEVLAKGGNFEKETVWKEK